MWFFHTDSERHIEKLLNGYPDGNFKPDNIITKAEVIAVLNRITQNDNNDDAAPFKDKLYWYSENNINYRDPDGVEVSKVFDGERYSLCEEFSVSENGENASILWSCPIEGGAQIKGVLYVYS